MTNRNFYILLIISITLLTSCDSKHREYVIGVSQCVGGKWREKINNEMLSAQHLYDHDADVRIVNADNDTHRQAQQIDSLTNSGVDILVVSPNEVDKLKAPIERALKKGIPVVFFDRKIEAIDYTAYIGGDNVDAGRAMGKYAVSLTKEDYEHIGGRKPVVVEMSGPFNISAAADRHQGFSEVMKVHNGIDYRLVKTNWTDFDCAKKMTDMLTAGEKIDVVFCHSDINAFGAYNAAKALGKEKNIQFLGVDGLPGEGLEAVQNHILTGTYIYPTYGEEIISLAIKILEGKPYKRNNTMKSFVVSSGNVDNILLSSNSMMNQNKNLVTIQNKLENYLGLYQSQKMFTAVCFILIIVLLAALTIIWKAVLAIKAANRRIKENNHEQTLFYTNASHQLKTPLTLISGPLKEIAEKGNLSGSDKEMIDIVSRNVSQLDSLVSNVLNFKNEVNITVNDENVQEFISDSEEHDDVKMARREMLLKDNNDELRTVLVVDDNADIRRYFRTLLASDYYVLEAADGHSGLQLARESIPDIIISDVMMPVMDGLQFCRKIKEDNITSHIPVILLTARSSEAQKMEGFEHGADAYITKPFSAKLLIVRIDNLLYGRARLREAFKAKVKNQVDEQSETNIEMSTVDRRFMDDLKAAINSRMGDSHLKMEDLGAEMNISRVQLYRKVKALTGMTPVDLLKQIRLQRGYHLLVKTQKTIQEVAYDIGFGTPGYFSTCFKKQYGKYPTDIRK